MIRRIVTNLPDAARLDRYTSRRDRPRAVVDGMVREEVRYVQRAGKEIPPTNKMVTGRGTYIVRVRGGKVIEFRAHPDIAGMMMQLGFMPQT